MKKLKTVLLLMIFAIICMPFTAFADSNYYKYFGREPTAEEKVLMDEHPDEAIIVYKCSKTATKYTKKYYKKNGIYDNSDAFRHCLWNALIKHDIGSSRAKEWTTAHESETPDGLDKDMDLYNCRRINAKGTKLIKTNKSGLKKKYK